MSVLKNYPALSAALVNIGVLLASYFGLHVTGDQLIYVVGLVSALLGVAVHSNVTPVAKLEKGVEITTDFVRTPTGSEIAGEVVEALVKRMQRQSPAFSELSTPPATVTEHNMQPHPESISGDK